MNKNFICYLFKVLLGHRIMQSETFEMVMLLEIPVFSKRHKEANKEGFVHDLQKCYITLTFDLENCTHLPIISLSLTLPKISIYKFIPAFVLKWINCITLLRYITLP